MRRVHVEKTDLGGPRWDLALELIQTGEGVAIESVLIHRYVGWPGADGKIHLSGFTAWDPPSLTETAATGEVERGMALVRERVEQDPRLASLLAEVGVEWDYRYDYGMGAITLADLSEQGRIIWRDAHKPSA